MELLKRFWYEEEALTAVEYGIMLGLLALVVTAAMGLLFSNLSTVFQNWANWFQGAAAQKPTYPSSS
ncbi:MAG: Flp family type IVb pilin [Desulfobaccales bacterium]